MDITVMCGDPLRDASSVLVVGCFEDEVDAPFVAELDKALGGCLIALYKEGQFAGKLNKSAMIYTLERCPAKQILLVGLGKKREVSLDRMRQAAGSSAQALSGAGVMRAHSVLHLAAGGGERWLQAAVEGFILGGYSFDRYKTAPDRHTGAADIVFMMTDPGVLDASRGVAGEARILCEAVVLARELVDQPSNVATPAFLAERAAEVSGRYGIDCRVMEREEIEANGMAALLAVSQGSAQPPRFIILEYKGGTVKREAYRAGGQRDYV